MGAYAVHGTRIGVLTRKLDSDGNVQLEYADDGSTGDYVKANTLTEATEAEWLAQRLDNATPPQQKRV